MPLFQSDELKGAVFAAAVLALGLSPRIASATLGEPEVTVQNDMAHAQASIKSSQDRTAYRVQEITLPSGTTMREFVTPGGMVFAIAWTGPIHPDLRQALGRYFEPFVSAPREKFADRRHVRIKQGDLVVQLGGHMRALSGRAYLASAIPSGVDIGELH
jgi:hypothetical protein